MYKFTFVFQKTKLQNGKRGTVQVSEDDAGRLLRPRRGGQGRAGPDGAEVVQLPPLRRQVLPRPRLLRNLHLDQVKKRAAKFTLIWTLGPVS